MCELKNMQTVDCINLEDWYINYIRKITTSASFTTSDGNNGDTSNGITNGITFFSNE